MRLQPLFLHLAGCRFNCYESELLRQQHSAGSCRLKSRHAVSSAALFSESRSCHPTCMKAGNWRAGATHLVSLDTTVSCITCSLLCLAPVGRSSSRPTAVDLVSYLNRPRACQALSLYRSLSMLLVPVGHCSIEGGDTQGGLQAPALTTSNASTQTSRYWHSA